MMNMLTISRTIEEAERFLIRARIVQACLQASDYLGFGNKKVSACRRASMDLTRALADLRRYPNQKE